MQQKHLLRQPSGSRILTAFSGGGDHLIIEIAYETLADYEASLEKNQVIENGQLF